MTLMVVLARTFAAFVFLFCMVRLIGKQQLSQITFLTLYLALRLGGRQGWLFSFGRGSPFSQPT